MYVCVIYEYTYMYIHIHTHFVYMSDIIVPDDNGVCDV